MLDPLSAVGLASSLVQFVTFTGDLISKSREIYKSADGSLVETLELETITASLAELSQKLFRPVPLDLAIAGKSITHLTDTERQLEELCKGCKNVASQLTHTIQGLKAPGRNAKWNSFRQALRSVWKEDQIKVLETRLERYRRQIDTTLLVSLRENLSQLSPAPIKPSSQILESENEGKQWQADFINTLIGNKWQFQDQQDETRFSAELSAGATCERDFVAKSRILEALRFHNMNDRSEGILEAHGKTFTWILSEQDPQHRQPVDSNVLLATPIHSAQKNAEGGSMQWSNFVQWLNSGSKLYWVTGKPGAGKSTLIKYLQRDSRTLKYLHSWAGELPLSIAGFFFWNSGTEMQMSKLGLLRTLVYDTVKEDANLMPSLFPERWRSYKLFGGARHPWSMSELVYAFHKMISDTSRCFFFFIDGLDEFGGEGAELANFVLDSLSSRDNIKMCVSSRPLLVFEDAFQTRPTLRLEDLTASDIRSFVAERLNKNTMFAELQKVQPDDANQLIIGVTEKASGVFLWVYLVVFSLLEGLRDGDDISDLQNRLLQLPPDLEDLFFRIIKSLKPAYLRQASKLFQLVRSAFDPLSLLTLSFAEEGFEYAMSFKSEPMPEAQVTFRAERMRRRLSSRCKGLLEAPAFMTQGPGAKVQYLHRTVRDYMQRRNVWEFVASGTDYSFDPDLILSGAFLLCLKTLTPKLGNVEFFWNSLDSSIKYCSRFDDSATTAYISILDAIELQANVLLQSGLLDGQSWLAAIRFWQSHRYLPEILNHIEPRSFFDYTFRFPLHRYIKYQFDNGRALGSSASMFAMLSMGTFSGDIKLLEILFQAGADANISKETHADLSVWTYLLLEIKDEGSRARTLLTLGESQLGLKVWSDIVELFLVYGADSMILIGGLSVEALIKNRFEDWDAIRTGELLQQLAKTKTTQKPKIIAHMPTILQKSRSTEFKSMFRQLCG